MSLSAIRNSYKRLFLNPGGEGGGGVVGLAKYFTVVPFSISRASLQTSSILNR